MTVSPEIARMHNFQTVAAVQAFRGPVNHQPVNVLAPDSHLLVGSLDIMAIAPSRFQDFVGLLNGPEIEPAILKTLVNTYRCNLTLCLPSYSGNITADQTSFARTSTSVRWEIANHTDAHTIWTAKAPPTTSYFGNTSTYPVDSEALTTLQRYVGDTGRIRVPASAGAKGLWHVGDVQAKSWWQASDSLDAINTRAQQAAESLTTYMRTRLAVRAPPADPRYAPTVFSDVTVFRVRWPWLSYPLALLLGGCVFLLATMWATRQRNVRPWKGHRIPLLLADLDADVRALARGGLDGRTGLGERVGNVRVRLDYDGEDRIAFRRVDRGEREQDAVERLIAFVERERKGLTRGAGAITVVH